VSRGDHRAAVGAAAALTPWATMDAVVDVLAIYNRFRSESVCNRC
jgi:hypothetical protein